MWCARERWCLTFRPSNSLRLQFGSGMALACQLAAVAMIRTFLPVFLRREVLKEEKRAEAEHRTTLPPPSA